jgi:hypothetical protein
MRLRRLGDLERRREDLVVTLGTIQWNEQFSVSHCLHASRWFMVRQLRPLQQGRLDLDQAIAFKTDRPYASPLAAGKP